jgi:DEAD/DEAH box helicase domain-containing protein
MCDRHDIGIAIESGDQAASMETPPASPRLFVYDNYPGGIGFSRPLYDLHHELIAGTRRLIEECPCENGCPGCVGPIGNTGPMAKRAALRILDLLVERAVLDTAEGMSVEESPV